MIGKQILHYQISEELGRGGMGIVYKAEDTKLKRQVALKFLPASALQGKAERERFLREAQAAAALNHTNIAHIYAIEEFDGQMFIAMEFIEGRSLEDMIGANGGSPLPLNDAIAYATQIAAGLQAAHEKGIVHRDIKSANIMVAGKGVVKIMDFGLAKLANRSKMTQLGSTLGTAAYMSPEQAQGQSVDQRSDIWSLGVVLYEMISGQMPFKGDYEQAVIYSILHEEPEPLTALRSGLPIALDGIVAKALAKDPDVRYQHVDELPADLRGITSASTSTSRIALATGPQPAAVRPPQKNGSPLRRSAPWLAAALMALGFVITLIFLLGKTAEAPTSHRLNIAPLTLATQRVFEADVPALAFSPDGTHLAFSMTNEGMTGLYLRAIDSFDIKLLEGTANAGAPFFSPDGQWIGFVADGKLKRIPTSGGAVETLCDAAGFRGASWGRDDEIIFSPDYSAGLMRIPASGGTVQEVTLLDTTRHERTHRWPQILPDGEWVLYTIGDDGNPNFYTNAELAIQSLRTGERHILNVRGEMARYVEPGYLIVGRGGALMAAPFSLKEFRTTKPLQTILEDVAGDLGSGISYFDLSRAGTLVYIPGARNADLELVWVYPEGKVVPLPLPHNAYSIPRLSPDGTRLAVTIGRVYGADNDIWIYDLKTSVFSRFTFGQSMWNPVWSRDSRRLYYNSGLPGKQGILVKPADGSRNEEVVFSTTGPYYLISASPGDRELVLDLVGGVGDGEIFVFDLQKKTQPRNLFNSASYEFSGMISPDGRFFAYSGNESGRLEVYIRSYPDLVGKWQISTNGGSAPTWSADGRFLYYISNKAKMMMVSVQTEAAFAFGHTQELFDVSQMFLPNNPMPNYDVSADGKRFIMVRNPGYSSATTKFNVILNWTTELQERFASGN